MCRTSGKFTSGLCSNYHIDVALLSLHLKKGFPALFLTSTVAMPPSDFATADIDQVLHELTTDEAILVTAGVGFWNTHSVERLGIPAIKVFVFYILHDRFIILL